MHSEQLPRSAETEEESLPSQPDTEVKISYIGGGARE